MLALQLLLRCAPGLQGAAGWKVAVGHAAEHPRCCCTYEHLQSHVYAWH